MKKKIILFILVVLGILLGGKLDAQVGIGTDNPDASSGLEIDCTDKGFLPPRMTTEQRNAINDPANGLIIFNISSGCPNLYFSGSWYALCGMLTGAVSILHCSGATITGTLTGGVTASGVSASVPYTGGNCQFHPGQTVGSTGVTGLTATLSPGVFNNGNGTLTYTITGTPAGSGNATFALNIGGQSCNLEIIVAPPPFTCGTSTVTFNYNGSSVTYGTATGANNRCWLDRNLGATQVATSSTDAASYGDLFQWGRLVDGHQVRTSPTTTTLSNSDVPGHGNFIIVNSDPNDWRSPQNNNLWQGVNGTNNPCPAGYRLPTQAEWDTERLSWSSNNAAGAFASPLKLPMAGDRYSNNGAVYDEGSLGYYWSSTVIGTGSWRLAFASGYASMYFYVRAFGMSVRCVKD